MNQDGDRLNTERLIENAADGARFSRDRQYRYLLWRSWSAESTRLAVFVGLNPSKADESFNDPTVRRCIDFAKKWPHSWKCDGLLLMNLYAYRTPEPSELMKVNDPRGAANTRWLGQISKLKKRPLVLGIWGNHGDHHGYAQRFLNQMKKHDIPVYCLRQNAGGQPAHPLYLPAGLTPKIFQATDSHS